MQKTVKTAFLLDVDGVITDPNEKKVTQPKIFEHIEKHLTAGNVITLNTGRSNEWMIDRVINQLRSRIKDISILANFYAVGEKGLTWVSFDQDGRLIQGVYDRKGVPVEGFDLNVFLDEQTVEHFKTLGKEAQDLISKKYSHSTFFDPTKKAMVSTEKIDGFDQAQFSQEQADFTKALREMMQSLGLEDKFNIDPTTIATDIQVPQAGKHLGTQRILTWLSAQNIQPQHFIAVGDSTSDLEMADELSSQGKNFDFYYVNPEKAIPQEKVLDEQDQPRFNVITTTNSFERGTIEMFERIVA